MLQLFTAGGHSLSPKPRNHQQFRTRHAREVDSHREKHRSHNFWYDVTVSSAVAKPASHAHRKWPKRLCSHQTSRPFLPRPSTCCTRGRHSFTCRCGPRATGSWYECASVSVRDVFSWSDHIKSSPSHRTKTGKTRPVFFLSPAKHAVSQGAMSKPNPSSTRLPNGPCQHCKRDARHADMHNKTLTRAAQPQH